MRLHLGLPIVDGVLPLVRALADLNGVKVLVELLELQLSLSDLVKGHTQQTVFMELTDVVKPWRGRSRHGISQGEKPCVVLHEDSLTDVELKAFIYVGVAAAPGLVVLLQHQDSLPRFGHSGCRRQAPEAAADDDDVQVLRHLVQSKPCVTR